MPLLPKTAAACPKTMQATSATVGTLVNIVLMFLSVFGPAALPWIESWLASLNLPPAVLAELDMLVEAVLKSKTPVIP